MRNLNGKLDHVVPGDKSFDYYRSLVLREGFPLISLVVPTYNFEKYVGETIDSIKAQTLDSSLFEVLFVDDCSTDRTVGATVEGIAGIENASSIVTRQNGGSSRTKNYGIRSSRGRYVMLLDGDDFLEPTALEATLRFMEQNPGVKYSYSQHRKVDSAGKPLYVKEGYDFSRERLLNFNFVGAVECFNRELFLEIGGYRDVLVEDYDFALRASEVLGDGEIARNPQVLYNHRLHGGNKSEGKEVVRQSAIDVIRDSLRRKEGLVADVRFSPDFEVKEPYSCFEWGIAG
ncbi:glycosyltransferase [archaeon]|jgi:glycosyltransferase involved in cell wall biosynthesis|nr:glycosyltransferase [archaeon]